MPPSILIAALALAASATVSQPLFDAPKVIDGDTMIVSGERVHLWAIDAPELYQMCERGGKSYACGLDAKRHLEKLIGKATVSCEPEGLRSDHGGEWVGICTVSDRPCWLAAPCSDQLSLNRAQLLAGHAVDMDGEYIEDQADARDARLGIWAGRFDMPYQWKAGKRSVD